MFACIKSGTLLNKTDYYYYSRLMFSGDLTKAEKQPCKFMSVRSAIIKSFAIHFHTKNLLNDLQ